MKTKSIDEAKEIAKNASLESLHKDKAFYIIYCSRTECFYIDTNSLIRNWEQLSGYYINGVYIEEG